jgi:hypothetical protein
MKGRQMALQHPEWKNHGPFKAVLANDLPALAHFSERDWAELIFATHAGMSQVEFLEITQKWVTTAKHPRFKQLSTDLPYQPMTRGSGISARQPVRDVHREVPYRGLRQLRR